MYQQRRQQVNRWEKFDKILYGVLIGILLPFIGLALLMIINEEIAQLNLETASGVFDGLSDRLIRLLAICLNLIPFTFFQRQRMDKGLRGVIFPTVIYAMIWFALYSAQLMNGDL